MYFLFPFVNKAALAARRFQSFFGFFQAIACIVESIFAVRIIHKIVEFGAYAAGGAHILNFGRNKNSAFKRFFIHTEYSLADIDAQRRTRRIVAIHNQFIGRFAFFIEVPHYLIRFAAHFERKISAEFRAAERIKALSVVKFFGVGTHRRQSVKHGLDKGG